MLVCTQTFCFIISLRVGGLLWSNWLFYTPGKKQHFSCWQNPVCSSNDQLPVFQTFLGWGEGVEFGWFWFSFFSPLLEEYLKEEEKKMFWILSKILVLVSVLKRYRYIKFLKSDLSEDPAGDAWGFLFLFLGFFWVFFENHGALQEEQ